MEDYTFENKIGPLTWSTADQAWFAESLAVFDKPTKILFIAPREAGVEPRQKRAIVEFVNQRAQIRTTVEMAAFQSYKAMRRLGVELNFKLRSAPRVWEFLQPTKIVIPSQRSDDRHVFVLLKVGWDEEHGLELHFKNEKVESSGPIQCAWQTTAVRKEARKEPKNDATEPVAIPTWNIAVPLPVGWQDDTTNVQQSFSNWRKMRFVKRLRTVQPADEGQAEATVLLAVGELPPDITVAQYRANLAAGHKKRNVDITYQNHVGFMLEGPGAKTMILSRDKEILVYQIRIRGDTEVYATLLALLP